MTTESSEEIGYLINSIKKHIDSNLCFPYMHGYTRINDHPLEHCQSTRDHIYKENQFFLLPLPKRRHEVEKRVGSRSCIQRSHIEEYGDGKYD